MNMPSRKTITATLFFGFILLFLGGLFWYFGGIFFTNNSSSIDNVGEERGFTFFPFGRGGAAVTPTTPTNEGGGTQTSGNTGSTNTGTAGEEGEIEIDRLRLIAEVPTAGGYVYRRTIANDSLFDVAPQTQEAMRFVEVETGHVYETTDSAITNTRVTNTTIPRVNEANFIDGNSVIMRYVDPTSDTIKTFVASITDDTPRGEQIEGVQTFSKLQGVFLPEDIQDVSVNAQKEILYTQANDEGMIAVVTDELGQNKKQIFSSPLSQWKPDWSKRSETITMTQYPSAVAYSVSQILNRTTERTTPLVAGAQGLDVLLSPNGNRALVSYKTGRTISLFLQGEDGTYTDTGLDTYAEKCIWSSDSVIAYCAEPIGQISADAPDTWYQGLETYSDDMWRINTSDVTSKILFSPFDEGQYSLDIIDLGISADEQYLYFRDKENQFFWTYQLEL